MLQNVFYLLLGSISRTLVLVPVIAFWWMFSTLLMLGYQDWLLMMTDIMANKDTLHTTAAYLVVVSFALSVTVSIPIRRKSGQAYKPVAFSYSESKSSPCMPTK